MGQVISKRENLIQGTDSSMITCGLRQTHLSIPALTQLVSLLRTGMNSRGVLGERKANLK